MIGTELISWYKRHGRRFLFRKTNDPYKILVTEIMLRKTTARQVEKVYQLFFEQFPSVTSLEKAQVKKVRKIIKPLGIASRAEDLVRIAKTLKRKYAGKIPQTFDELTKLPSVGEYIAGCVLTFAYNQPRPLLDSNVMRVLSRLSGGSADSICAPTKKKLQALYSELVPPGQEREFHYALLDISAKLCRPSAPACAICPLATMCQFPNVRK